MVSPVLCNLFMHYVFDLWMKRTFAHAPWCRYADDGLVHCKTEQEAQDVKAALANRLSQCGLQMQPDKTPIVYCKDSNRRGKYPNTKFDFPGYAFRPRSAKNLRQEKSFVSFTPAVSSKPPTAMWQTTRQWNIRNRADLGLTQIARMFNLVLRGWLNYYRRFHASAMQPVLRHFDLTLIAWAMRKYKKLKRPKTRAGKFLIAVAKREPHVFVHWKRTMDAFA